MKYPIILLGCMLFVGCTQETQHKFGRAVQNWTGTDGILEIPPANPERFPVFLAGP